MKRIIKFKAKRLDNAEWVEGYYVKKVAHKQTHNGDIVEDGEEHLIFGMTKTDVQPYWHEVDPSTVCQFTGLKDKNGVEIWEHDILKYMTEREVIIGSVGVFLKAGQHLISLFDPNVEIEDGKLIRWSNLGSKFDRKEGE